MNDIQIYLGHHGNAMKNNTSFYFANYFDWIFMKDKVIKKNEHPNSCYIKTDYLQKYINDILNIKNDFILISGCSDFSPQINFKNEFNKIIELSNLKKWYAENNLSTHPKMYSLSVGFATHSVGYEKILLSLNKSINIFEKKDKIFSCFRMRGGNCCGSEYNERTNCDIFIKNNEKLFDVFSPLLSKQKFQETLLQYKWCFCPLGNGVDHSPKLLECFFLKTIPICKKNINSYNLYKDYPIIWIDNFNLILNKTNLIYDYNINWDSIIKEFTCDFIYKKIIQ